MADFEIDDFDPDDFWCGEDYIGPIPVSGAEGMGGVGFHKIGSFIRRGNAVVLSGFFDTRHGLDQLNDLFRKAPDGSAVHSILGGIQKGEDLTPDHRLIQYCCFDSDKLIDGYYLLRTHRFLPDQYVGHYPFRIELFFLGSKGIWKKGYIIQDLESETNSWDI